MTGFGLIGQFLDGLGRAFSGTVLRVDRFGNLVTNISPEDLACPPNTTQEIEIGIGGRTIRRICRSYAEAAGR